MMDPTSKYLEMARSMTPLWKPLTDEQRQLLADNLFVLYLDKNELVFQAGTPTDFLFYLSQGAVTLFRQTDDMEQVVRLVEPGALFGYQEAFSSEQHTISARCNAQSVVIVVPMVIIFNLIWENSSFAMVFIKELAQLLDLSVRYTTHITRKHIRGRLAESLLRMKEKYGVGADGHTIAISLSRKDLAGVSNMTTSNAIRTLSAFQDEGLIGISGRSISILDEEGLRRESELH